MSSVDDVLDVVVNVEGTISGRSKGAAVRASESAACDEAFVDVIGVRQLGRPSLMSGTKALVTLTEECSPLSLSGANQSSSLSTTQAWLEQTQTCCL